MDDLLNQTCKIYKASEETNEFGTLQYDNFVELPCRSVAVNKLTKNQAGDNIVLVREITIKEYFEIGDKVESEGINYLVEGVSEWRNNDEFFGSKAYCSIFKN